MSKPANWPAEYPFHGALSRDAGVIDCPTCDRPRGQPCIGKTLGCCCLDRRVEALKIFGPGPWEANGGMGSTMSKKAAGMARAYMKGAL